MVFGNKHCTFNIGSVDAKAQFDKGVYNIEPGYIHKISGGVVDTLAPAGLHGFYSNPIQTFSQGVKRRIRNQWDIHREVSQHYNNNPEMLRFMFLIGWELGSDVLKNDYDYTNTKFKTYYNNIISIINNNENTTVQTIIQQLNE